MPQLFNFWKFRLKAGDRFVRFFQQLSHERITLGLRRIASLFRFRQTMLQGVDEKQPAPAIVEKVVLQIGIALDGPDVPQHLVEHAGGAAGAALASQFAEDAPGVFAQQAAYDFLVGKGGVVVGNFTDALQSGCRLRFLAFHGGPFFSGKVFGELYRQPPRRQLEAFLIRRRNPFSIGRSTR